ncbi:SDR family NAD(P)-dependent oxidoreductase [Nocardia sp. NPDC049149]|uniref:SDR family NAD(P)-dependent oxidoreductase n=1 Tax=Nocardia sp. NPDC049149 TaxID=3364315 RepID=UPI0037113924
MSRIDPRGAVVVVTGAGNGIGAATTKRYAGLGAQVCVVDIDESGAAATAAACRAAGGEAHVFPCDVADLGALRALADTITTTVGPVDVLVNNAGVGVGGPFLDTSLDDWQWLRSINLDAVVHGCHLFGAAMVERGKGHIVNVASGAAYIPNKRMATYCASKAAVVMLSRCLRADWAANHVGVSAVCPGVINTGILDRTRLRGSAIGERAWMAKAFSYSHAPDSVAKAIVGAVAHNRAQVSVGIEAQLAYHGLRLLPGAVHDVLARA